MPAVGLLLAFAYPDRIGMARGGDDGRYLLGQGRGAALPGPSALARSEFIVAAEIDAGEREAKLYLAAPLERALARTIPGRARQGRRTKSPGTRAPAPSWRVA